MNAKRAKKLMQIARYYGEEEQVCKPIEELGEATSAASEVLMQLTFHEDGGKGTDLQARLEHLAAELADVQNVAEQVLMLFGLEVDFKVARMEGINKTLQRISGGGLICRNQINCARIWKRLGYILSCTRILRIALGRSASNTGRSFYVR